MESLLRHGCGLLAAGALMLGLCAAAPAQSEASPGPYAIDWSIHVPLRDGVRLNAIVYRPTGPSNGACIVNISPYGAQRRHAGAGRYAAQGYTFYLLESRGRGGSGGVFRPDIQEAQDGYDAVEWVAGRPECGGKVVMWGLSYMGHVQWAAAMERPPHLATIVPVASPHMGVDFPYRGGILSLYAARYLTFVSGAIAQESIFGDLDYWTRLYRAHAESGAPYGAFGRFAGSRRDVFDEWAAHPSPDAFWDAYVPSAAQYAALDIPILTITGSYDVDQPGALEYYRRHMRYGAPAVRDRHYLVIGPWDHGGTIAPQAAFGGLTFGAASLVDIDQLHLDWYAWALGRAGRPAFLQDRVAYYVMGAETWRYAPTLEAVTAREQPFYLESDGAAGSVFESGRLAGRNPERVTTDSYLYDPRDLTTIPDGRFDNTTLVDQREIYAAAGRQLVYHSAPFERATEISGAFRLKAWIAIDQPDTDFQVSVYEIKADGGSIFLTSDLMRARYRSDERKATLVASKAPLLYDFRRFSFVSRQVAKGSRLRLVIAPVTGLDKQRNFNSGKPATEESAADSRSVTVRLFHGGKHESVLLAPIGRFDGAAN